MHRAVRVTWFWRLLYTAVYRHTSCCLRCLKFFCTFVFCSHCCRKASSFTQMLSSSSVIFKLCVQECSGIFWHTVFAISLICLCCVPVNRLLCVVVWRIWLSFLGSVKSFAHCIIRPLPWIRTDWALLMVHYRHEYELQKYTVGYGLSHLCACSHTFVPTHTAHIELIWVKISITNSWKAML